MVRKSLAAVAVLIEFAAMGGFVIPELSLPSRSAFTQFFVMCSYVLLLKWTWCAVAGRKRNLENADAVRDAVEKRERLIETKPFTIVELVRRHSSVLLIIVGILVALLIAANRYRLVTAGGSVYRLDRFTGRCEKIVSSMGSTHFVSVREQGGRMSKGKSNTCGTDKNDSGFNLTKWLESDK